MKSATVLFTVISNNYLHFARTMLRSAKRFHPDFALFCFVVDADISLAHEFNKEFNVVSCSELDLPEPRKFLFQYSILEANTAVKAWAFAYLLNHGFDVVVYVDPDVYFYSPLRLDDEWSSDRHSILLTPHLLHPIPQDGMHPNDLDIRRTGTYNMGFCAIRESEESRRFLTWWQEKLRRDCVVSLEAGIFVDQSWIDLVPGLFSGVGIVKDPGYNVAYWNIGQRTIERTNGGALTIQQRALVFFHFSGLDISAPAGLSKYQDRYTLEELGPVQEIVTDYVEQVRSNGAERFSRIEYGYSRFADGEKITDEFRRLYRENLALQDATGEDPFASSECLCLPYRDQGETHFGLTNAMMALWRSDKEIQRRFQPADSNSIAAFFRWYAHDAGIKSLHSHAINQRHQDLLTSFYGELSCHERLQLVSGVFSPELDVNAAGIWAGQTVSVPVELDTGKRVQVIGTYFPQLIKRSTGSAQSTLHFEVGGQLIHSVVLKKDGDFVVEFTLEATSSRGPHQLTISSSAHFQPRTIGTGDDRRRLSWRLKRLIVGDVSLFDCTVFAA